MSDTFIKDSHPSTNGREHQNGAIPAAAVPVSADMPRYADDTLEIARPKRRRWRLFVPVVLLLLAASAVGWYFFKPAPALPTASVSRGTIISTVETTGKLQSEKSAKLSFRNSGRVARVLAKQGDIVTAGTVLAELDTTDLQRQLDQAKVQLEISKLKLQQAKEGAQPADIASATANLNGATAALNQTRSGGRAEDIAAAQAQYNQAQSKLDALKRGPSPQDVAQAEAGVREAQAKLAAARQPATPQDISQAEAALREAKAKLGAVKAGPTKEDIAAAQAGVNQAQASYDKLKAPPSAQDLAAAQARVDQAKASRDQIAATASNTKEQARLSVDAAGNAVRNAQDAYNRIKSDNDQVSPKNLTNDQRQAEDHANRDVQDAQSKLAQAQLNYETAKQNEVSQLAAADASTREAQAAYDKLKAGASASDLAFAQAGVDQAKAKLAQLMAGPRIEDVNAAQAGVDQAQAKLDALKAGGTPSQISAAQAGVDQANAALAKVKAGATADDIRGAQQAVAQAQANLDKVKNGATPQEISQAQSKVDAAQAALDKVKSGPTETDQEILSRQISLSQLSVSNASAELDDSRLTAPMGGTVLLIDLEVGELVGAMQPIATVADTQSLRVKADIDEIDVGRVTPGQVVTVTLDAYPGVKMPGKIEALAPGATQKQGSTVYQATISFTPIENVVPREGMAANVDITAQRKDNVLLLPNRAFETVGRKQFVAVREASGVRKIEVETGLTNATDTEVVSGLTEGQVVMLK